MAAAPTFSLNSLSGPQKVALLMLHMGKERSSRVLRAMRDAEVEEIMTEVTRLNDIPGEAIDHVLKEFRELAAARSYFAQGGVSFAREMLEESLGASKAGEILDRLNSAAMERPFDFLRTADPRQMLSFLQDEHPQTIALVVAHLHPERAAIVISGLPEDAQGDVARRIAVMDRTSPEVLRQVASVLERKASALLQPSEAAAAGGIQPLVEILNRSDRATEKLILENLERHDPELADEVRNRMFVFEDITTLDDRSVQLVLREIDSKVLAVALKGVRNDVRDKVLTNMSERASTALAEEIDLLGPIRLKQVEEAQAEIVKAIRKLEEAGQVVISRGGDEFID